MRKIIFDMECDSLNATKIHCFCYTVVGETQINTLIDYEDIKRFLLQDDIILVGHNIIRFDIPVLERLLKIKIKAKLIDTLTLSWYLHPLRHKHDLKTWGKEIEIEKIIITDWKNLDNQEYVLRCSTDVKITEKLFTFQMNTLVSLYENEQNLNRILNYLFFKMDCAREQEEVKWKLDIDLCNKTFDIVEKEIEEKVNILKSILPDIVKYKSINKPEKMLKKDSTLSVAGKKWLEILKEKNLPLNYTGSITIEDKKEESNPNSTLQIKEYLFSLNWKPTYYKQTITAKGFNRVPQITINGEICPNIKLLYSKQPKLVNLERLSVLNHRKSILAGFLKNNKNGYVIARIKGLTNTLRFQHTELVNIPSVDKPLGKEIRSCLICNDDEILCGSDMVSLEDKTKMHYLFFYDPEYVKDMEIPDFDPHLDIAEKAKMLTKEQVQEHKTGIKKYDKIRKDAKQVNFACVYGAGISKIMETSGLSQEVVSLLHKTFWKRNWAIKKITNNVITKKVNNQTWLFNPVSKFWYVLKYEKDAFSTLNQGTGCYCFDIFVNNVRKRNIKLCGQFHDELIFSLKKGTEKEKEQVLNNAIQEVNDMLKLNVILGISYKFGKNYAEIH